MHRICFHGSLENEEKGDEKEGQTKWKEGYDYMKAHREGFIKFILVWCLITCLCSLVLLIPIGIAANFYLKGQGSKNGGSAN